MKQLTNPIKQNLFDDILSGKKKNEIRDIRTKNVSKYCETDERGYVIGPKHYDTIKLLAGKIKDDQPYLIVKVISSRIILWEDEETMEPIMISEEDGEYQEAAIEYKLGEILSTFKCDLHKKFA